MNSCLSYVYPILRYAACMPFAIRSLGHLDIDLFLFSGEKKIEQEERNIVCD
jgi:hypothetical protein